MKRSKNQAVYKFLPETWVSEHDESNVAVTAKIIKWNYDKMQDIYDDFIENEIKRQIELFGKRGGDITSFDLRNDVHSFCIVEPKCLEGIPDIFGEMSPLVFYCSSCGHVIEKRYVSDVDKYVWNCTNHECKKRHSVKQLQMIYACECGFAQGVRVPYLKGHHDFKYHPNENQFKMFYKSGNSEKAVDIAMMCPTCNSRLLPDNANAGRNYKAFTLSIINLVDTRSGEFYKKGEEAQKAIIAKWFGKMSQAEYETILDNVAEAFSERLRTSAQRKVIENKYNDWVERGIISRKLADTLMQQEISTLKTNRLSVERYADACDAIFIGFRNMNSIVYREWLNNFSFKLMQYNTIKYARRAITLEDSINRQIEMEFIESAQDVYRLHEKLGITNMQVSSDIQIVNCTYGYSRRAFDPKKSMNKNCRLKLNAYDKTKDGSANLVYGVKLDTEGILFEISQKKIIEWLRINQIIREEQVPDLNDDLAVKKWFAEYVHSDEISMFGDVDENESITKNVFGLLHSMSHAFIRMAGELSGLSSNSLTEIIIVETASIFIYAQTSQGIPLGALSGMAEMRYEYFLRRVLKDSRNCVFDPICTDRDDTTCSGCLIIPEISCDHFNAELGRKYMYSIEGVRSPKIGFWEM